MPTVRELIRKSMLDMGALTDGGEPTDTEASDALAVLNDMLGEWSNDGVTNIYRSWELFDLEANRIEYTIGANETGLPDDESGIDFITKRPIAIVTSYVRIGSVDYPLSNISDSTYNDTIPIKSTGGIPQQLSYDNGFPIARIRLYPVSSSGQKLFLLSEKGLDKFENLNENVQLPPGWNSALRYNLAFRLCLQFGQKPSPELAKFAFDSKDSIASAIARNRPIDAHPKGFRGNIYGGWEN